MKHFLKLMAVAVVATSLSGCKSKAESNVAQQPDKRALVCYFSATGNTRADAERIARITSADIFVIEPQEEYTDADLDWTNDNSRSSIEMHDLSSRPAIKAVPENIADYDIVFIGFPNWWDMPPTLINTFIDQVDLSGKSVVPFMTSGSSTIDNSEKKLHEDYPNLKWEKGLRTTGSSEKQLSEWINPILYPEK